MSAFSLSSWFRRGRRSRAQQAIDQRPRRRPKVEELEPRLPPGDLFGVAFADPFGLLTAPAPAPQPAAPDAPTIDLTPPPTQQPSEPPALLTGPASGGGSGGASGGTTAGAPVGGGAKPTTPGGSLFELLGGGAGAGGFGGTTRGPSGGGGVPTGPSGPTSGPSGPMGPGGGPTNPGSGQVPPQVTDVRNDAGASVAHDFTNDTTPKVFGTASPNQAVQVLVNGQGIGTALAGPNGEWSFQVSTPLAEGLQQFSARPAGVGFSIAGFVPATIDTTPPAVTLEAADFVGRGDEAWVRVNATDLNGVKPEYHIDIDLDRDGHYDSVGERDYAVGTTTEFTIPNADEGTYKVRARAFDLAGNEGVSAPVNMQFDPNAGYLGSQLLRDLADGLIATPGGGLPGGGMPGGGMPLPPGSRPPGGGEGGEGIPDYGRLMWDDNGRVLIQVRATRGSHLAELQSGLEGLGMDVSYLTVKSNMITGYLAPSELHAMAELPHFNSASHVPKPFTKAGSLQSEGDAVMRADVFRNDFGVDGTGINIGVLSDSVDQFQGGLADSVSTGDLPPNVTVLVDGSPGDSDEGRAMLEHIFDVAPGSGLFFRTAFNGEADFAQGVRDLAAAGAQVITDDIGYLREPIFSSGRVGQAIDEVVFDQNVIFTSAAGNSANVGWRGTWTPRNATIDGVSGTFMDFGGDAFQDFTLADGSGFAFTFSWDEFYLEGGDPNFQVGIDMAVHIVNRDDNTIAQTFDDDNPNLDQATEFFNFVNSEGTSNLAFAFQLKSGGPPTRIAWMLPFGDPSIQAEGEGSSTILGHPLARGAIATGAVGVQQPDQPESFSSFGGDLEIFFHDRTGQRFDSPEIRQKPDVSGPDGAINTFFGNQDPNGDFRFFGTSAAAPHVAAAAALILEQSSIFDPVLMLENFQDTAIDLLSPGFDPLTGFGLVQVSPLSLPTPDAFEENDTSDRRSALGTITGSITIGDLSILNTPLGLPDYDWFEFVAGTGGTASVSLKGRRLEVQLFTVTNGFLTPVGTSTPVTAGDMLAVQVKGQQTRTGSSTGKYSLTFNVG